MSDNEIAFVADLDLRLDAPRARRRVSARLVWATLAALAIDLGVFAIVWEESRFSPSIPPQAEEIPVEIVSEPPPPPPPPPPPEPSPPPEPQPQPQSPEYEKPATDAPRAGKSDHDDDTVAEKEKPAETPPPPPAPTPTPEASPEPPAAAPEAPKAAEAELPAPEKAEPTNTPAPSNSKALAELLAKALQPPPEVEFGGEAMNSPVTGGNAKSTYLTKLYGLIVPKLHVPAVAHAYGRKLTGAVSFSVDGHGRLRQRFISSGSGSMELDEAAMEAVAAASHAFPPPPHGSPVGMTFTYTVQ